MVQLQTYFAWTNYHSPSAWDNTTLIGPIVNRLVRPSLPDSFFGLLFAPVTLVLLDYVTVRKALGYNLLPYS